MPARLRPRTVSELVDAEFELLRRHYLSFLTIVAVGFAPVVAGGIAIALVALGRGPGGGGGWGSPQSGAWLVALVGGCLVMIACFMLMQAALIFGTSDAYLDDVVDVAGAFRRAAAEIPTLFGAYLLAGVLTLLGYVCLIIPGIYLAAALFAVPAVVLLEHRGPGAAIGRSFALTKGRKLQVLGALLVAGAIAFAGRMTASAAAASAGGASPGVAIAVQVAAFIAFYPLTTVMAVLLYYDARIRFEGFDIERAAAALESTAA